MLQKLLVYHRPVELDITRKVFKWNFRGMQGQKNLHIIDIIVTILRVNIIIIILTLSASSGPPYSQGGTGKYGFESDLNNDDSNDNGNYGDDDDFTICLRILPAC